ncbi:CCA tRNA nucleotidyltransferase [Neptunomonas japonica]|uniref:CCA tRNA nucleotidyltransferase n=1 Tax=Neptunomonas japonica TaxID=417574 RepID=UPI0004102FA5|nr:CCA tRNA nucleotidyltransferase [Neptunomonas japonica]
MKIYLVGGAVRDKLLNYPVYDKDWVVVGATPQEMIEHKYKPVGSDFPVFIHPTSGEEYALARTERKSGKGYSGFQYHASPDVTLEEDLSRRDLTINAMAQSDDGQIFDPYGGQKDLTSKILRHVSPAFSEDPLRVLRVARFAARYAHLGFTLASETLGLMQDISASDELEHLTRERVWQEMERALGETSPLIFFQVLHDTHALNTLFPRFALLIGSQEAASLQKSFSKSTSKAVRFASLSSLCFMNETDPESELRNFCQQLKTPNHYRDLAAHVRKAIIALHQWKVSNAEQKLSLIQALDLLRRPERISPILEACQLLSLALYQEKLETEKLEALLTKLKGINPQELIKKGYKGAALGSELKRLQLEMCQD